MTEPTSWKGGLVAISNFGFGGSNVHCIVSSAAGSSRPLATTPFAEEVEVSCFKTAQKTVLFSAEMKFFLGNSEASYLLDCRQRLAMHVASHDESAL